MIMNKLLSGDYPKSKILGTVLAMVFIILAVFPIMVGVLGFSQEVAMKTAVQICVFMLLAASYDMLLGYTAVISFAHAFFFAVGAYSIAIMFKLFGDGWGVFILACVAAVLFTLVFSIGMALLGLRVRSLFFTMITLAIAAGALVLVVKLSRYTGGLDGATFDDCLPEIIGRKVNIMGQEIRIFAYYAIFVISVALFWLMLRIVNSPFGRVLKAIRENEFRTMAIGFKPVNYRVAAIAISCVIATIAGILYAAWTKTAVPNTYFTLDIMLLILICVVVGGMGTMYGAVVGAVIMVFLQNYLRPILVSLQESGVPEILQTLLTDPFKVLSHGAEVANEAVVHAHSKGLVVDFFDGSRYLMYIGFIYILCVYFFSEGVVGKLRVWAALGKADIRNMAAKIFDFDNLNMKNFFKAIYYTLYVLITLSAICQAINGIANLASDNGFLLIITAIVTKILGTIILRALFELVFGVIDTHKFAKEARDTLAEQK